MPTHPIDPPVIDPRVPDELLIAVLTSQLDESIAIERGHRAAKAQTEKERRTSLFPPVPTAPSSDDRQPTRLPLGPMPWFEP